MLGYSSYLSASDEITVAELAWFDDNWNGILDTDEELAANATVTVAARLFRVQPTTLGKTVTNASGTFEIRVDLQGTQDAAVAAATLRAGFPYDPAQGENYRGVVSLPVASATSGGRLVVRLPLHPLPGVWERLPPGSPPDYPIPDGHFFTQTNGYVGGSALGFPVTNADGIPFWDTWQRLGLARVGYPLSDRFRWGPFPTQVFQKAVFQWQPGAGLFFVNVFDELHAQGHDPALATRWSTPAPLPAAFDAGKSAEQIVADRLALLAASPAIADRYWGAADPVLQFGLPTSRVETVGNARVLRTQRAVFQEWLVAVPWAGAGEVTIANGGEVGKDLGVFPREFIVGGAIWDPFRPVRPPDWAGG